MKTTPSFFQRIIFLVILFTWKTVFSQTPKITHLNLNTFHITSLTLCDAIIMNPQSAMTVYMEASLRNEREILLKVKTGHFLLKQGVNHTLAIELAIISEEWSQSKKAFYLRNSRILPTGKYQHCIKIIPVNTDVSETEEGCEEVESEFSVNMFLVYPPDKDTISESRPMLSWGLTDPMGLKKMEDDYYRLILTGINLEQNAETALLVNNYDFIKNSIKTFQIQYPVDAPELMPGKHYAWRVQLLSSDGMVQNQTEAWEFTIKPDKNPKANKYALLNKTMSSGFYTTEDNHIYFCFNKEYSAGEINSFIYNAKREMIIPKLRNAWNPKKGISVTASGYNQFDINLQELEIARGFHTLEVKNEKGEWWYLRVMVK